MTDTAEHLFRTVLVANRGEIACRIIQSLAAMDIRPVAVYSDADRNAKHVSMADLAVRIGPAAATASYLNIDAIITAARASGAEAIHPGYGFLSENAAFAQACEDAGLVFIGPGIHALDTMGDKIRAKNHVASHSVPVIAGIAEPGLSDEALIDAAAEVGYPLLVKPSAGGGGKGMQIVERPEDLAPALVAARRVAAAAFGDDTLLLEHLIPAPRHIEVQVLADTHGTVIHLGERECSLQRRHQKVIEEAPSSLLDDDTRARIGEAACEVARSVGYVGAGTIEFLVSNDAPTEFFFMEMNTRLQVEHPVTEMVTGLDLVEWQIRIAAGQALTVSQDDVRVRGHAVEARIYAENPERGFLPSTGTVLVLEEAGGEGVRVDSSLIDGLEITPDYDPLLSKVIAWGRTREQAHGRLDSALAETTILGVHTNVEYLRALVRHPDVRAGNLDTSLIERRLPELEFRQPDDVILAACALYLHAQRWRAAADAPWRQPSGWRMGGTARPNRYNLAVTATKTVDVSVIGTADRASAILDGIAHTASLVAISRKPAAFSAELDGVSGVLTIAQDGDRVWIGEGGFSCEVRLRSRKDELADQLAQITRVEGAANPELRSPMPGTVVAVNVATGDTVAAGQTLLTVEAMKMEHKLLATLDGVVTITVKPADLVKLDQVVASITPVTTTPHEGAEQEKVQP